MSTKQQGNGVTQDLSELEAVIAAGKRRADSLADQLTLAIVRPGTSRSGVAAVEARRSTLAAELEELNSQVTDWQMRLSEGRLAQLESEAAALREATATAYEKLKAATVAAGGYDAEANRKWGKLRNAKDAAMARWRNSPFQIIAARSRGESVSALERDLAEAEAEAKAATEALDAHERGVMPGAIAVEQARRAAEVDWNTLSAEAFDSSRRLEQLKRDPSIIAILRVKSPS